MFLCRQCFLSSPGPPGDQHNPGSASGWYFRTLPWGLLFQSSWALSPQSGTFLLPVCVENQTVWLRKGGRRFRRNLRGGFLQVSFQKQIFFFSTKIHTASQKQPLHQLYQLYFYLKQTGTHGPQSTPGSVSVSENERVTGKSSGDRSMRGPWWQVPKIGACLPHKR